MKNPIEFEVNKIRYRARALPVFDQSHIARKLSSPLVLVSAMQNMPEPTDPQPEGAAPWQPPGDSDFARAMLASSADMPDDNVDWVIGACLSVIDKFEAGQWFAMRAANGALMYADDIADPMTLWTMVWKVVQAHKLPDVFRAPPRVSAPGAGTDQTSSASQMPKPSFGDPSSVTG